MKPTPAGSIFVFRPSARPLFPAESPRLESAHRGLDENVTQYDSFTGICSTGHISCVPHLGIPWGDRVIICSVTHSLFLDRLWNTLSFEGKYRRSSLANLNFRTNTKNSKYQIRFSTPLGLLSTEDMGLWCVRFVLNQNTYAAIAVHQHKSNSHSNHLQRCVQFALTRRMV